MNLWHTDAVQYPLHTSALGVGGHSWLEIQLRDAMHRPLLKRKVIFRKLQLHYHPDKNKSVHAKAAFQCIGAAKSWFLA